MKIAFGPVGNETVELIEQKFDMTFQM